MLFSSPASHFAHKITIRFYSNIYYSGTIFYPCNALEQDLLPGYISLYKCFRYPRSCRGVRGFCIWVCLSICMSVWARNSKTVARIALIFLTQEVLSHGAVIL